MMSNRMHHPRGAHQIHGSEGEKATARGRKLSFAAFGLALLLALPTSAFGQQAADKASSDRSADTTQAAESQRDRQEDAGPDEGSGADALGLFFTNPAGSERPCIEEPPEPLPSNACYKCQVSPAQNGCPATVSCIAATTNGRKYCSITIGGGQLQCQTSGGHCTTV
ncbi:MAG: hypothetical protein AAF560_24465 [Acidobacteriota bacterium]